MKKALFAVGLAFVLPMTSFAYSVTINPVAIPCGSQSVEITGTADYSDNQFGSIHGASLTIFQDYKTVLSTTNMAPTWSVVVPVSSTQTYIEAKINSSTGGYDYGEGVVVATSHEVQASACSSTNPPQNAPSAPVEAPSAPVAKPNVDAQNHSLLVQFVAFLEQVIK